MLGRAYRPVRFVVSTRADIEPWLELQPAMEFKLDVEAEWDRPLMERLAALDRVRVLDLKAYYRGTSVDLAPDPAQYAAVAEIFPDVVIEDPWLEDGCREALAGAESRLSFDAPVHSLADLDALPLQPKWLNVKPSRFGTVRGLFDCIDACEQRGIAMYGGGQYELGAGPAADPAAREPVLRGRSERRRAVGLQRGRRAAGAAGEPAVRAGRSGPVSVNLFARTRRYARARFGEELGATLWGGTMYELGPGERLPVSLARRRGGVAARRRRHADAADAGRRARAASVGRRRVPARARGRARGAERR